MLRFSSFRGVLLVLCASFWCSAGARAQAFELEAVIAGVPLGTHMGVLRDPTGELDIHQVANARLDRFVAPRTAAPSLGLDEANFWIRLPVSNPPSPRCVWAKPMSSCARPTRTKRIGCSSNTGRACPRS